MFCAEVEPATEHSFLLFRSACRLDRGVVGADQDVLVGQQVRTGEVDLLQALVVDRVGGGDELHVTALDRRLAVGALGLLEDDVLGVVAEFLGHVRGDIDVEAGVLAVGGLQADARLVDLDADRDLLAVTRTARAAVLVVGTTGGGGEGESEHGGRGGGDLTKLHGGFP